MRCVLCHSANQQEFGAEIMIHLGGPKNIDHPGVLVFPRVSVCVDCGFSHFITPDTELVLLAMCSSKSAVSDREADVHYGAFSRNGLSVNA